MFRKQSDAARREAGLAPPIEPPLPRGPGRKIWGFAWKFSLFLIVLIVLAVAYLQSAHALRHVIVPHVAKILNTKIDYREGDLGLDGTLDLDDMAVEGSDGSPAFSTQSMHIRVDPRLLLGGKVAVREARLAGAQLRYTVDARGRSNWDFLSPAGSMTPSSGSKSGPRVGKPFPEVHVDQLDISGMELLYEDGKGLVYNIDPLDLKASNLARGEQGKITLAVKGSGKQGTVGVTQQIDLKFDGSLKQGAAGELVAWAGKLNNSVSQTTAAAGETSQTQTVQITGQTDGEYATSGKVTGKLDAKAALPTGSAGDIVAAAEWVPGGKHEIDFDLKNVTPEAINPLLIAVGPLQLKTAAISGRGQVRGEGDQITFSIEANGSKLSFRRGKEEPTAPLALTIKQTGAYNAKKNTLRLNTMSAGLQQADRKLLNMALNKPADFELGKGAMNNADAQLVLEINDMAWADLKPWFMILNVATGDVVKSGRLKGKVTLDLSHGGRTLALESSLTADDLKLNAIDTPPLKVTPDFRGTLIDYKTVNIERGQVGFATSDGENLASTAISGQFIIPIHLAKLKVQLDAPQLTRLIDMLNGPAAPPANVSGGSLQAVQNIEFDTVKNLIGLDGTINLNGLTLKMKSGETPLSANGEIKISIDQVKQLLQIKESNLKVTGAGATEPGLVQLSGNWPLAGTDASAAPNPQAAPRAGNLKLNLKKFDAAPWLALAGMLQADPLPRLPIEADEEINIQGDNLNVKGTARVGLPAGAGSAEAQELEVKHALEHAGSVFQSILLDMNGNDSAKTFSNVHIEGNGRTEPEAHFDLSAKAESLDLDALLARIDAVLGKQNNSGGQPAAAPAETAEKKTERPSTLLNTKLEFARFLWRGEELRDAKARVRFERGVWTINIDESLLNGGPFKGQYTYDGFKTEPTMAWDLQAERTPIEKLLSIGAPEAAKKINGLAAIHSRGSGEGTGAKLKSTLQGVTEFKIQDGELKENLFLDALADQTFVPGFKHINFFDFSGGLNMAGGRIDFNETVLKSKVQRINIRGWFGFDGRYQITLIPAIGEGMLGSIKKVSFIPSLIKDVTGMYRFPFGVTVRGEPGKYIVLPRVDLPVNFGDNIVGKVAGGAMEGVNQGVGLAAEGVRDTVGGVFRVAGKGLNVVTGRKKETTATTESNSTTTDTQSLEPVTENEPTTKSKGVVGKTTGIVKEGASGLFKGVKKLVK